MKIIKPPFIEYLNLPWKARGIATIFFALLLVLPVFGQQALVKSTNDFLNRTKDERSIVDSLPKYIDKLYMNGYFNEVFEKASLGLDLVLKNNFDEKRSYYEITLARCYQRQGNVKMAINFGQRAIKHSEKLDKIDVRFLYNIQTMFYDYANKLDSALYYNYLADSLTLIYAPHLRFQILNSRSEIYSKQGLGALALESAELSVENVMKQEDEVNKLWILHNVRGVCLAQDHLEKYGYYTKMYMDLIKKRDPDKSFHKGIFQLEDKSISEQIRIVESLRKQYKDSYYQHGLRRCLEFLSVLYLDIKDYENAYKTLIAYEPLIKETHFENSLYEFYERKFEAEKNLGKHKDAVITADILMTLRDTIQSIELVKQNLELAEKYESQAKDQEILLLNQENELKDVNLKRSNFTKWVFALGSFFLVLFSYYLFRNIKTKKETNQALERKNEIIKDNLLEKETLLKEIHHRVKNNLQIISSLLRLQSRSIQDPGTKEALLDGQNRVQSMALIHRNLYKEDNLTGVEVKKYFENLCQNLLSTYDISDSEIQLDLDIEPISLDVSTLIPMGLIVNELFTNTLKYAYNTNEVKVLGASLKQMNQHLRLEIYDNGKGIPEEMKQHLMGGGSRDKVNQFGFGTRLLKSFAQKLDAEIIVKNIDETKFILLIKNYKIV